MDKLINMKPIRFTTRYEVNDSNLSVMNCKAKCMEILKLVMDIQTDIRITRFLRRYKEEVHYFRADLNTLRSKSLSPMLFKSMQKSGIISSNQIQGKKENNDIIQTNKKL